MNTKKDGWISFRILLACIVFTPGVLIYNFGGEETQETAKAGYVTLFMICIVVAGGCWWVWKGRNNLD